MNLFNNMVPDQVVSAFLMIGIFSLYSVLVIVSLASFYVTSRPRSGRVRSKAAAWHLGALAWFLLAIIACVWAAPAEGAFYDQTTKTMFSLDYAHVQKVIIGAAFALVGVIALLIGWSTGAAQGRDIQRSMTGARPVSN